LFVPWRSGGAAAIAWLLLITRCGCFTVKVGVLEVFHVFFCVVFWRDQTTTAYTRVQKNTGANGAFKTNFSDGKPGQPWV
jgi:hypothetical protein